MDAHEIWRRQTLLHLLHAQQDHDGLVLSCEVDAKIFRHSLHIDDVVDENAHHLVFRLQEEGIVLVGRRETGSMHQVILSLHLVGCSHDIAHSERFEQVVEGSLIHTDAYLDERILLVTHAVLESILHEGGEEKRRHLNIHQIERRGW